MKKWRNNSIIEHIQKKVAKIVQSLLTRERRFSILFGKVIRNLRDLFFALLVVCEVSSFVFMLQCTMCTSLFVITAGLNVPWWPELYTILRLKYFRSQNVFINRQRSTKLAIGMLDELWRLTSKDRLHDDRAKIRTPNFMIFQKSRLKLINSLFENRLMK